MFVVVCSASPPNLLPTRATMSPPWGGGAPPDEKHAPDEQDNVPDICRTLLRRAKEGNASITNNDMRMMNNEIFKRRAPSPGRNEGRAERGLGGEEEKETVNNNTKARYTPSGSTSRPMFRIRILLLLALPLIAAGCRKKEPPPPPQAQEEQGVTRPSATLGIYVNHFLGRGIAPYTTGVLRDLEAQTLLLAEFDPLGSDSTFALLQEFGNVLQVDVADLLNRSNDRPATLTAYTDGLSNITERSKLMREELQSRIDTLRTQERDARGVATQVQKRITDAYRKEDYATAGSLQEELSASQLQVTRINAEAREARDV